MPQLILTGLKIISIYTLPLHFSHLMSRKSITQFYITFYDSLCDPQMQADQDHETHFIIYPTLPF